MMIKPILLLLLAVAALGNVMAQDGAGDLGGDYVLGPGDLIEVEVLNVEDYKHAARIDSAGDILLPYLGKVAAKGITTTQLSEKLAALMNDVIFRNPSVSVTIKEHRSQPILVLGAVRTPGTYQKTLTSYRLIDLLSAAGGVDQTASDKIVVQRDTGGTGEEKIELALSDIYGARLSSLNFQLQPGDVVTIPPRDNYNPDVYFVIGEVLRPGDFSFPQDRDLLVSQAVAAAGGALKTAKTKDGVLVRFNEDGTQTRIPFNYGKVLAGKGDDMQIQPQDIIFIPGSNVKTIMYGLLGVIPNAVQQATTTLPRP